MKRIITLLLALSMLATVLVGCGGGSSETTAPATNASEPGSTVDPSKPYAGTVLKYACTDTMAVAENAQRLVELVKEKTGIIVEFNVIPRSGDGEVDKTLVSLQAGDDLDIMYGTTPGLKTFYNAGVLTPLDELAEKAGYDMEAVFGSNLPVYADGKTYGLPSCNDIWVTFINTQVFEELGVEVPTAEGWTWEKYIETAKKVNAPDQNIWGSLMMAYDNYNYMYAQQKGAVCYKEDGTANFDDPLFKEGLEWFASLGNVEKIQPDITTMVAKVYPWNAFTSTGVAENGVYSNPRFGMFVCGGWVSSLLANAESYPRDWECVILPMPYPEGEEPSTLTVTGNYAIPSTSKHKEAAFEAIKVMSELEYTLGYGLVPARVDLTDEEVTAYVEECLVPAYAADGITAEMFKDAWFNPNRKLISEKIIGNADSTLIQIWIEEARLYCQGQQDIDKTMTNIQERSNKAIAEEQNN